MQAFTTVTGPAAPLMAQNVDTDVIIRIDRLTDVDWDKLGPYAFEAWRGFYPDSSFDWQNWVSLVVLFLLSGTVSVFWFRRTDVQ